MVVHLYTYGASLPKAIDAVMHPAAKSHARSTPHLLRLRREELKGEEVLPAGGVLVNLVDNLHFVG